MQSAAFQLLASYQSYVSRLQKAPFQVRCIQKEIFKVTVPRKFISQTAEVV